MKEVDNTKLSERIKKIKEKASQEGEIFSKLKDSAKLNALLNSMEPELLEEFSLGYAEINKILSDRKECGKFSSRRTSFDVFVEILNIAAKPTNKTNILYRANLSYSQLTNYLAFLLNHKLLIENGPERKKYFTTKKGFLFLLYWKKLLLLLE